MTQQIKNKLLIVIAFVVFITGFILPSSVLALNEAGSGGGSGSNPNQINLNAPGNYSKLGEIESGNMIGAVINLIYIVSTLTFFFVLLMGGVKWITSSGDEKKLAAARSSITHGLIGLGIVFLAWALMRLIGLLFDFNFANLTIKSFI